MPETTVVNLSPRAMCALCGDLGVAFSTRELGELEGRPVTALLWSCSSCYHAAELDPERARHELRARALEALRGGQ